VSLEAENGVLRAELHEVSAERDELLAERARLAGELQSVSVERDELSAKLGAALAKIVELTKQVFGSRSERAKKDAADDRAQDAEGEGSSQASESTVSVSRERRTIGPRRPLRHPAISSAQRLVGRQPAPRGDSERRHAPLWSRNT